MVSPDEYLKFEPFMQIFKPEDRVVIRSNKLGLAVKVKKFVNCRPIWPLISQKKARQLALPIANRESRASWLLNVQKEGKEKFGMGNFLLWSHRPGGKSLLASKIASGSGSQSLVSKWSAAKLRS